MLEEVELYVYDKFIKKLVWEDNGRVKISKEDIDRLELSPHEKNFVMYIINKKKIKVVDEFIRKGDRSSYVKDNDYGNIKTNGLENVDLSTKSIVEYSEDNEKIYEDYSELEDYLENRFIPEYIMLKNRKNDNGEIEQYLTIRLSHIMALRLSEVELEFVMNYLKDKKINVVGKASTLDGEFDNYDYLNTYKSNKLPLSVSSEITLEKIRKYKETNNQELREEIIKDNMRLVPFVLKKYRRSKDIDYYDLEGYGYEGLIMAIDKFDVNYGYAFSSYAVAYIRGYIFKGMQELILGTRDIMYHNFLRAKKVIENINGITLDESPDLLEDIIELLDDMGKFNNIDKDINKIMVMANKNESLDDDNVIKKYHDNGEFIDPDNYEDIAIFENLKDIINDTLDTLTPHERLVIIHHYGLNGEDSKTLDEIANMYGTTREHIRQLEKNAMSKLKDPIRSTVLEDYLDFNPYNKNR